MALTVEDPATADAFASLDTVEAYAEAHGHTAWTDETDDDAKEAAIRRGTSYLSNSFTWKGWKTNGRLQTLAWPRSDVLDEEDEEVASDEIPAEIANACCEAAIYELANPGGLSPTVTLTDRVKRESIAGAVETEYFAAPQGPDAARPAMLLLRDMIAGLLSTSSSSLVGTAVRS